MRIALVALVSLVVGALLALGYDHYLGEGKQLADTQGQLDASTASLTKVKADTQEAKSETDALSDQVKQLTATKDDLQHQLDQLKSTSTAPAPAFPGMGSNSMASMMKAGMAQHRQEQLLLLESRLHLTPDQIAAVSAAMDEEAKRGEEMAAKMFSGGKIDMTQFQNQNVKSVDQTLNDILTPDQKTAYEQMKTDQKNSATETVASMEMNQVAPLLQLSDSQKDQVYSALYQVQQDSTDPNWIKANVTTTDPGSILDAQAKAKEDALSKILTPDQMATYQQQTESQLAMQKAMMQKMNLPTMTGVIATPATVAPVTPVPASTTPTTNP
jgi:hypothetical protein